MQDWIWTAVDELVKVFISTMLVFSLLIGGIRIAGLRSFAKMSSIDFASTIAIGSILATTVLSKSPSVFKGIVTIGFILLFQKVFSILTLKLDWFDKLATNKPLLLMDGEKILYKNLHKVNLSEGDLMAKLREANVIQLSEVYAVVLENTGDVSVLHGKKEIEMDKILLKNVVRS